MLISRLLSRLVPAAAVACFFAAAGAALAQTAPPPKPFDWDVGFTSEAASNVSGGARNGSAFADQFYFGGDANLAVLLGLKRANLHLAIASRQGDNVVADYVGSSTSVQEIYGAQNTRLVQLVYRQTLGDGRSFFEGGRTVANVDFLGSPICAHFQNNASCGNPTMVFRTTNFTYWPVSSWGAHALLWATPRIYFQAGGYEVNPIHAENGHDIGLDWSTRTATGVVAPFALGYFTDRDTDRYARRYEVGGIVDSSSYTDPLDDAQGIPAVVSGNPYAGEKDRSVVWGRIEQMVTRPDIKTDGGLTLFATYMTAAGGRQMESRFYELGALQIGTLRDRPEDSLGFVITQQQFSPLELENLGLARALAGGIRPLYPQMTMLELNYGIAINKGIRIAPNLLYVIHPDQVNEPSRLKNLPNAFLLGVRVDIDAQSLIHK